ncbi:MAG: SMI1/KNR4 family protein [Armatimonadetes bacterium]|nr:SMI1/KNR4 family protein [Armatimonadota bacterium]
MHRSVAHFAPEAGVGRVGQKKIIMDAKIWETWLNDWKWVQSCMKRKKCEVHDLVLEDPMSSSAIQSIKNKLSIVLPAEFVRVVTTFASGVSFLWYIEDDEKRPPAPYSDIFSGGADALWDAERLVACKETYDGWIKECFSDPSDPYDKVWHDKTPFLEVPNGDLIAFDVTAGDRNCPVVYLSHDDGELHGSRLGADFVDFVSRWSHLGCPGPEEWQIQPFHDSSTDNLLKSGPLVENWRKWLAD